LVEDFSFYASINLTNYIEINYAYVPEKQYNKVLFGIYNLLNKSTPSGK